MFTSNGLLPKEVDQLVHEDCEGVLGIDEKGIEVPETRRLYNEYAELIGSFLYSCQQKGIKEIKLC